MIYRREFPNTPSKRFRTSILSSIGIPIKYKQFYINKCSVVARHSGTKVCLRRKKSIYISKFNLYFGSYQNKYAIISELSLARRYKTFVGILLYSDGSMSILPLFNGAFIGGVVKTLSYVKNPKIHFFVRFKNGYYVPIAYLGLMSCFFNIMQAHNKPSWFCRAAGTFCILFRVNISKGYCTIKIPSNKYLIVHESSYVMLGRNLNLLPKGILIGKAGLNIKRGFRPAVRGVAKNPVDHPHGGRTKSNSPERTPWGRVAKFNK